jgi:hypothetical protein
MQEFGVVVQMPIKSKPFKPASLSSCSGQRDKEGPLYPPLAVNRHPIMYYCFQKNILYFSRLCSSYSIAVQTVVFIP